MLEKVLACMQSARRGFRRLEAALEQAGPEVLTSTLRSFDLTSVNQIRSLKALQELVLSLEQKVSNVESHF